MGSKNLAVYGRTNPFAEGDEHVRYVLIDDEDEVPHVLQRVHISWATYVALGRPDQITVCIEPGDTVHDSYPDAPELPEGVRIQEANWDENGQIVPGEFLNLSNPLLALHAEIKADDALWRDPEYAAGLNAVLKKIADRYPGLPALMPSSVPETANAIDTVLAALIANGMSEEAAMETVLKMQAPNTSIPS
jgi:hypothetical protein